MTNYLLLFYFRLFWMIYFNLYYFRLSLYHCVCLAGQLSMQWQCKQAVALKCIIQFRYVTEAFSLYSCTYSQVPFPCSYKDHALTLKRAVHVPEPCSGAGYVVQYSWYIEQAYTVSLYTHESCMHVAVRVLVASDHKTMCRVAAANNKT